MQNQNDNLYTAAPRATWTETQPALPTFRCKMRLYGSEYELSAFRFQLDRLWHVAVVGEPPPETFDQAVQAMLSGGTVETLTPDLITFFNERRIEAREIAPWVERHYRPDQTTGE